MTDGPDSPNFEGVMRWQVEGVERASLELFGHSHEDKDHPPSDCTGRRANANEPSAVAPSCMKTSYGLTS